MLFASYLGVVSARGVCPFLRETLAMCQMPVPTKAYDLDIEWPLRSIRNASHTANPTAVLPNRLKGREIAAVEEVPRGGPPLSIPRMGPGIAGVDGDELKHARVAVTVNHATGAAVANQFRLVPFIHVAN